jgi:quercetin dioxygenase-like cupin family protein
MSRTLPISLAAGLAAAVLVTAAAAQAQPLAVHKTTLQEQAFPAPTWRTVTVRTVIDPRGEVAPHTHPGAEMAYVLAGKGALVIKGAPPRALTPGDSFSIPEGEVHSVRNSGAGALTLLSTYVVEKDKPIASPAP